MAEGLMRPTHQTEVPISRTSCVRLSFSLLGGGGGEFAVKLVAFKVIL